MVADSESGRAGCAWGCPVAPLEGRGAPVRGGGLAQHWTVGTSTPGARVSGPGGCGRPTTGTGLQEHRAGHTRLCPSSARRWDAALDQPASSVSSRPLDSRGETGESRWAAVSSCSPRLTRPSPPSGPSLLNLPFSQRLLVEVRSPGHTTEAGGGHTGPDLRREPDTHAAHIPPARPAVLGLAGAVV